MTTQPRRLCAGYSISLAGRRRTWARRRRRVPLNRSAYYGASLDFCRTSGLTRSSCWSIRNCVRRSTKLERVELTDAPLNDSGEAINLIRGITAGAEGIFNLSVAELPEQRADPPRVLTRNMAADPQHVFAADVLLDAKAECFQQQAERRRRRGEVDGISGGMRNEFRLLVRGQIVLRQAIYEMQAGATERRACIADYEELAVVLLVAVDGVVVVLEVPAVDERDHYTKAVELACAEEWIGLPFPDGDLLFAVGSAREAGSGELVAMNILLAAAHVNTGHGCRGEVVIVCDEVADRPEQARDGDLGVDLEAELAAPFSAMRIADVELGRAFVVVFTEEGERRLRLAGRAALAMEKIERGDCAGIVPEDGVVNLVWTNRIMFGTGVIVRVDFGALDCSRLQRGCRKRRFPRRDSYGGGARQRGIL